MAPKNDIVGDINDYMSDLLPGEERTCLSLDSPHSDYMHSGRIDNVHSTEFLNTISSSGLPNHKLMLKVGVPIMLLKNVDQIVGLSNGTRLLLTRLNRYVLEGKVISGTSIRLKVYIPRLSLTPSDSEFHSSFKGDNSQSAFLLQ